MEVELASRKTAAATRIAELERQAGIAVLDGKDIPESWRDEVESQRQELVAVENAEAELVHRQREAAAAEHAERVKELRNQFANKEGARLDAVARAHTAANHLMSSLSDALAAGKEMETICQHLGKAPPIQLGSTFVDRLSDLVSGCLARVIEHPGKFGRLTLLNTGDWRTAHDRDWREHEQKQLAGVLAEMCPIETQGE